MFFELAIFAYLIDSVIGELPCKHPVMFMGDFISAFERRFYRDSVWASALLVLSLLTVTAVISFSLVTVIQLLPSVLAWLLLAVCASTGLVSSPHGACGMRDKPSHS
jgi:adenosylcobinamide-phosphate synthase